MRETSGPHAPLSGVRVVEFAGVGVAPYGTMLLSDLGSDVIRVDRPGAGSDPSMLGHVAVWRGRRTIIVDRKHPDGRDVIDRSLEDADVLVERERSGLGQVFDVAMVDGGASLTTFVQGHAELGAIELPFFRAILDGLGLAAAAVGMQRDRERWPELRVLLRPPGRTPVGAFPMRA